MPPARRIRPVSPRRIGGYFLDHGSGHRIGSPQGVLRGRPLRRGLLQGRARRPARAGRPERRRQDDAPARSRRPGLARGRRAGWQKGARVALHDQRPPDTSARPLREYVLSGTADLAAVEQELRVLEAAMSSGDHGAATLRRYARRRRASSTRAATTGATAPRRSSAGSASRRMTSTVRCRRSPAAS